MRFELYSLICQKCGARNAPDQKNCVKCQGPVRQIRRCPGCQKENPPNAFVCLYCYRILKSKPQTSFINFYVPWTVSVLVVCLAFGWASFNLFKGWVDVVSAQLEQRTQEDLAYSNQRKSLQARRLALEKNLDVDDQF